MSLVILCTWSCILIYIWMVKSKYYLLRPPISLFLLFGISGVLSTIPALLCNLFLSRETELWVYSSNKLHSFLGFMIGAGMGEEFWKLAMGTILIFILPSNSFRFYKVDIVLGFVILGLSFGAIENLVSYSHLDMELLVSRGLIAVPLHGSMGMIHGLAISKALEKRSTIPLITGYLITVSIHTLCDTWSIFVPLEYIHFCLTLMATTLIFWGVTTWRRIPELEAVISR